MRAASSVPKLRHGPTAATWQGPHLVLGVPSDSFNLRKQEKLSTAEGRLLSNLPDLADRGSASESKRETVS